MARLLKILSMTPQGGTRVKVSGTIDGDGDPALTFADTFDLSELSVESIRARAVAFAGARELRNAALAVVPVGTVIDLSPPVSDPPVALPVVKANA